MDRYVFDWDPIYRLPALGFGITGSRAYVQLTPSEVVVRFGPWRLRSALSNIESVVVTGGYNLITTIGPAHVSLSDLGVTFATNRRTGVCLAFRQPVAGIEPTGMVKHPGATITIKQPQRFLTALNRLGVNSGAS